MRRVGITVFARAIEGKSAYMFTDERKVANIALLEAICIGRTNAAVAVEPIV